jgi:hypothetical protein
MNDQDLRDCFAMFAMCGVIMRNESWHPDEIWEVADAMLEARKPKEVGIKTVKRTRKTND